MIFRAVVAPTPGRASSSAWLAELMSTFDFEAAAAFSGASASRNASARMAVGVFRRTFIADSFSVFSGSLSDRVGRPEGVVSGVSSRSGRRGRPLSDPDRAGARLDRHPRAAAVQRAGRLLGPGSPCHGELGKIGPDRRLLEIGIGGVQVDLAAKIRG